MNVNEPSRNQRYDLCARALPAAHSTRQEICINDADLPEARGRKRVAGIGVKFSLSKENAAGSMKPVGYN